MGTIRQIKSIVWIDHHISVVYFSNRKMKMLLTRSSFKSKYLTTIGLCSLERAIDRNSIVGRGMKWEARGWIEWTSQAHISRQTKTIILLIYCCIRLSLPMLKASLAPSTRRKKPTLLVEWVGSIFFLLTRNLSLLIFLIEASLGDENQTWGKNGRIFFSHVTWMYQHRPTYCPPLSLLFLFPIFTIIIIFLLRSWRRRCLSTINKKKSSGSISNLYWPKKWCSRWFSFSYWYL